MLDRAGGFLRWLRFTMVAVALRRRGSVLSGSRWSVTGLDLRRFSGELFVHSRSAISNWTGLR